MCKFKSGIIFKNRVVLAQGADDSHTELLKELEIRDSTENAITKFVRAELLPPRDEWWTDPDTWKFVVDQDIVPEWFDLDSKKHEDEFRAAVKDWCKEHVLVDQEVGELSDGYYLLKRCKVGKLSKEVRVRGDESEIQSMCGNSVVECIFRGSIVKKMFDHSVVREMRGESVVEAMYDNSIVKRMYGSSVVKWMYGSSVVERMYNRSVVEAMLRNSVVKCMHDTSVVERMYDRSVVKVMLRNSVVKCMHDTSVVERMYDHSVVKHMYDNSVVEYIFDSSMVEYMSGNSIVKETFGDSVVKKMSDNSVAKKKKRRIRLYVDMDGVLCKWQQVSIEEVARKGYFAGLPAQMPVVNAIKELIKLGIDVYILSSVFNDEHSIIDKNNWLDKHLPEIPMEKRLFVPYSEKKCDAIMDRSDTDFILDDFSKNLHEWHGIGIKLLNGINGTNGTWSGFKVNADCESNVIAMTLIGIMETTLEMSA